VAGLLCLALAWTVFCLWGSLPAGEDRVNQWIVALGGLLLVAMGVGTVLFPRAGHVHLIDRVPQIPQSLAGGIARPAGQSDLDRRVNAMAAWVRRLALDPDQCLRRSGATNARRNHETLFDFLAADWDRQLAEAFRQELKVRSDKPLKVLALQPVLWAECVARELLDARTACPDLASLFALQAVKAWVESHTLAELLSFLKMDMTRFCRLVKRLASPHWPATRVEPEISTNVIAVSRSLWDALAPLARADGAPPMVLLDWDAQAGAILVLHVVQGLGEGWRGFPGMPGQRCERRQTTPADLHSTNVGEGHPEVAGGG
jgi:hypothetical protein